MQLARHDGQIGHDDQLHHTRHGLAGLRGDSTTFSSCPSSPGGCAPTPQAPGGEGRRVVSGAARSRGECEDKDRDDEIDRHGEPCLSPLYQGPISRLIFTDFYRFFGLSWETSTFKNYHPQDSEHSGSGRIEFSSKSTTFLMK